MVVLRVFVGKVLVVDTSFRTLHDQGAPYGLLALLPARRRVNDLLAFD